MEMAHSPWRDEAKWGPVGPGARHENPRKLITDPNKIYDEL